MRVFLLLVFLCWQALSHPHVFVEAGIKVTLHPSQAHVHLTWQFDEMTSMMLLMDFDTNGDGKLDAQEVAFLKEHAFDHLESLGYYTVIGEKGQERPPPAPSFFNAHAKGVHLLYEFAFTLPLGAEKNSLTIGAYDEDNLVAFFLNGPIEVRASAPKKQLTHTIKREDRDFYSASLLHIYWKDKP